MKNQSWSGCIKPLLTVGLFHFIFALNALAADSWAPMWSIGNISNQVRQPTLNYSGTLEAIGAGSILGNATNNQLTVDGLTVSTETDPATAYNNKTAYIAGGVVYHQGLASSNKLVLQSATVQGRTVYGGAALLDSIDNRLATGSANNNTVSIKDSSILKSSPFNPGDGSSLTTGGDVVGGYANYANGHADQNTVTLDNTTVAGGVYGGKVESQLINGVDIIDGVVAVEETFTANENTVNVLNNSTAAFVYGASGGESPSGNTVLIDNSTVGIVLGAVPHTYYDSSNHSLAYSTMIGNSVTVQNNSEVNSAYAVAANSVNAISNTLTVANSKVSNGNLYAADIGLSLLQGTPINSYASNNVVVLKDYATALNIDEIGGASNWAGYAAQNGVELDNISGLTVLRGSSSFGGLRITTLANNYNLWSLKNAVGVAINENPSLASSYGFIYGGSSVDYTSQMNDANVDINEAIDTTDPGAPLKPAYAGATVPGKSIRGNVGTAGVANDGNVVYIQNSTVSSNIMGGMAAQLQEVNYATWTYTAPSSGTATSDDPAKYTKTAVTKTGNVLTTTTTSYEYDGTYVNLISSSSTATSVTEFENAVFSASNNTVVLEDSHITGSVYGGYVIGADLKVDNVYTSNNIVVLRGNTTLDDSTVIYGGNAYLGRTTNNLVFDHVGNNGSFVTYNNKSQFQNFNPMWQINADLDTRINFNFNNLVALVNVDMQNVQEGSATIIKAQTTTNMSDVVQNGVVTDLIDDSVGLVNDKLGIYSFSLTGVKVDATTVGWVLKSVKDSANAEVYGQSPLAGVALALQGQDLLATTMQEAWSTDAEMNTFVGGGYDKTRYTTGSGFDLQSGLIQAGMWKKLSNNWLGGFFLKYAGGHYETFPIDAKGDISAYGGGLMTSLQYSETGRLEANVEAGYMRIDFESVELHSDLKTHSAYYGGMLGLVQTPVQYWDLFARLQYLHKNGDTATDNLEQKVKYDAVNSLSLRAGTEYAFGNLNWGGLVPSLGVSGLYEFDGESKVEVLGLSDSHASLKGFSGRGEVGFNYSSEDTFLPILSKLTVFGQVGKRRGFGVEANISFQF